MNDETLQKLIEYSGAMWAASADRRASPVLLRTPESKDGFLYELTLPEGEHHPFWRVRVREMGWDEREGYAKALALGVVYPLGFIVAEVGKVEGHVFNGRRPGWNNNIPALSRKR